MQLSNCTDGSVVVAQLAEWDVHLILFVSLPGTLLI